VVAGALEQLAAFLSREFAGIELRPGGYEGWPHLRFELGGTLEPSAGRKRAAQAAQRATSLFEAAFAPDDDGFASFTRWHPEDDHVFMSLLPEAAQTGVERLEGFDFYKSGDGDRTPCTSYTASVHPRALDYVSAWNVGRVEVAKQRVQSVDHVVGRVVAVLAAAADVACVKPSIERLEGSEVSTDHLPVTPLSGRLRMTLSREEGEVAANHAETREYGQENDDRQRDRESSTHEVAIGLRVGELERRIRRPCSSGSGAVSCSA
jgi:hypothetical protein